MMREKYYPWARKISKPVAVKVATLLFLGRLPAPGTWGSAAGVLLYPLLFGSLGMPVYLICALLLAYFAVGFCDAAERHLNMRDPGMINLDEFAAMPFCFINIFGFHYGVWGVLVGFALFRFFDIKKPLGVYRLQSLEGGFGCVADDIGAALYTAACLNVLSYYFPALCA